MKKPTLEDIGEIVELAIDKTLPALSLNSNLYQDIGMDSLGAVAMVVEIQRRFGIKIPDDSIPKLLTPMDIINEIDALITLKESP